VQSLVPARDGLLSPEFSSIEEYLGHNTQQYYAVLRQVQPAPTSPSPSATPGRGCAYASPPTSSRRTGGLNRSRRLLDAGLVT
jgi:hypothetical protein